ncbi:MAG: hypothetical protein K2G97_01545, partial [Oscillospiraceae bacterium]|nr:hypothetical protein [Oscillospiraceae bacterium]
SDNGKINSCQTTCNVKANAKAAIVLCGGFLGLNSGKIEDCVSKGKVYGCSSYNVAKGLGIEFGITVAMLIGSPIIILIMGVIIAGITGNKGIGEAAGILLVLSIIVSAISGIGLIIAEPIKIKDYYVNVGGFCGSNIGEIIGSRFEGAATANATTFKTKCGGFVGDNDKQGKISSCIATGSAEGQEYVGGFAGVNKSEIVDCNANVKATAKTKINTALAGGFVGENEKGIINNCTATGGADSRSSLGQAKAGGFVGTNKASIMNSKANGNVYLSAGTFQKDNGCGGFAGKNDQGGSIDGCYAECIVETTNKKKGGGFVGEAKSKSTIKNSQCKTKIVTKSGTKNNTKFCENKDKKAVIE